MKNTVRIITAVILAIIMCVASVTALAAEEKNILKWNYHDYGSGMYYYNDYEYIGTVKEGENAVDTTVSDSYRTYVVFNAEKSGYYRMVAPMSIDVAKDYIDGTAYGAIERETVYDGGYYDYFYIEEGENIIGIYGGYYYEEPCSFTIEYLGGELTDIVLDEALLKDLLEGCDISVNKEESSAVISVYDFELVFSEKTVEVESGNLSVTINPESGEYFLTFLDYSEPVQITTCKATDIIKSMEITNLDECLLSYGYYNGEIRLANVPEAVKVTFTDGTVKTYENKNKRSYFGFDVEAPNGREYYSTVDTEYGNDGKVYIELRFAWEEYARYEVSNENADVCDNLGEFNDENGFRIDGAINDITYRLKNALSFETDLAAADRLGLLSGIFGVCTNAVFQIFCNFVELLEYYF